MAEMYGKANGCCRRPRRLDASVRLRRRTSTAATPSSAAACRSRSASRWPTGCRGQDRVTACFFGEGAVAEGEFHETMNLAALWALPVLFVCENNRYAMGTALARTEAETDLAHKAPATACTRRRSTAWTWSPSRSPRAARRRRDARRPAPHFLECRTYRFRAHSMFDAQLYRDKEEIRGMARRGPIVAIPGAGWSSNGLLHERGDRGDRGGDRCRGRRSRRLRRGRRPGSRSEDLARHVVAESRPPPPRPSRPARRSR